MPDFVKSMRENSWISLEIFTAIFPFLLGILGLILAFIWDLSVTTLAFFPHFNEQAAVRGGCFPSSSCVFQALCNASHR